MFGTVTRYYEDKGYGFGDIKGIREEKNLGRKTNQQLHSLPYARIYMQLEYKLKMQGIRLIRQEESYSSQCPPQSEEVSRIYAEKKNRKKRCIYIVDTVIYNTDAVGAYNILRKYHAVSGKEIDMHGHRPYIQQEEYQKALDFSGDIVVIHLLCQMKQD